MGICLIRRCVSDVTYAYYELDYIQGTGTQFINTGYTKSSGDSGPIVKASIAFTSSSSSLQCILGCDGNNYEYHMYTGANTNNTWYLRWRNNEFSSSATWSLNTRYTFQARLRRNTCYVKIDDTEVISYSVSPGSNYPSNGNFYLLACNSNGTAVNQCYAKLYFALLWEDSTPLRVWVPCLRASDSEVGLYDIKNNVFYPNAGTGKFSYGSIVGGLCSFK